MKTCRKCMKELPLEKFRKSPACKQGVVGACRKCEYAKKMENLAKDPEKLRKYKGACSERYFARNTEEFRRKRSEKYREKAVEILKKTRWYALMRKYGLTQEQYEDMVTSQEGKCAICKRVPSGASWDKLCVDHCHKTGKIRELLCQYCNAGIGSLQDDPEVLQAALNYLKMHRNTTLETQVEG